MLNKIVRDPFGQHYKIHTTHDGIISGPLTPKSFRTPESAQMFVKSLQTPTGCWQYLVSQCNGAMITVPAKHRSVEQQVSQLLLAGQIKLYPITLPKLTSSSPKRRTLKGGDKVNYQFTPVANMLLVKPREVKRFNNKASAEKFLSELQPDEKQLKALAAELDIPISSTAAINPTELSDSITTAMASGEVVIIVDRISSAPPGVQQAKESNPVGNREVDLGPHETAPVEEPLKDIDIVLEDEFEQSLKNHASLLDGLSFTLKTDKGQEHTGSIENNRIFIPQAQISSSFELTINDLPGYQEA